MATLDVVAAYLDELLRVRDVPDYRGALNGLQVANTGEITHVATAVDCSTATVAAAAERHAQLLFVHHGMFWGDPRPIVGHRLDRVRVLIRSDIAVYAAHLPLDVHPQYGNNALLADRLGLAADGGFARFDKSLDVGLRGSSVVATAELVSRCAALAEQHGGRVVVTETLPDRVTRRWGICTGAGASSETVAEAIAFGLDTLIVGEGPHHTAVEARDAGIVIIYAGHYATETLGVRAVGDLLRDRFSLSHSFIEAPTGL